MISIEKAAEHRFERSTREEIVEYLKQVDDKFQVRNHSSDTLRRLLCDKLGIEFAVHNQAPNVQPLKARPKADIFPPYNLTFNGIWGGLRRRLKLNRPRDAHVKESALSIPVQGNQIWLKFGEVYNLPAPHYFVLRDCVDPQPRAVENDDRTSQTTEWTFEPKYNITDFGWDEETKDRCVSLTQWYQMKGPDWIKSLSHRDRQAIAALCDIPTHETNHENKRTQVLDEPTVLASLMVHFFGYPDVESIQEAEAV